MLLKIVVKFDPLEIDAKAVKSALVSAGIPENQIEPSPCRALPKVKRSPAVKAAPKLQV